MLNWRNNLSFSPATPFLESRIGKHGSIHHRGPLVQHDLVQQAINLIYPQRCCACRRPGRYLCPTCYELLHFQSQPIKLNVSELYLDSVIVVGTYTPPLADLIHALKFQSIKGVGTFLGELLYQHLPLPPGEALVPIPLSRQRFRERGFNQSEQIAISLGKKANLPVSNLLIRAKHLSPQALIADQELRKSRLNDSFQFCPNGITNDLPNSVILVDDVITTGTTLNQAAKILKQKGITQVWGMCVAHGK